MDVRTADPGRLVWYLQGELEFGAAGAGRWRPCRCLHVNDKFRVGVREASELVLVQVHDEEFVGGRELHRLPGELFVEVGSVAFVLLSNGKHRVKEGSAGRAAFGKGSGAAGAAGRISTVDSAAPNWRQTSSCEGSWCLELYFSPSSSLFRLLYGMVLINTVFY